MFGKTPMPKTYPTGDYAIIDDTLPSTYIGQKLGKNTFFQINKRLSKKTFTDKLYKEIEESLLAGKVICPIPYRFLKLKKWSVKQQYFKDHDEISWNLTEVALKKLYPQYTESFNEMGKGLTCSWYNMLIASWEFWDGYLTFLFDILLEVKKDLVVSKDPLQRRIFGNLSERLLYAYSVSYTHLTLPTILRV